MGGGTSSYFVQYPQVCSSHLAGVALNTEYKTFTFQQESREWLFYCPLNESPNCQNVEHTVSPPAACYSSWSALVDPAAAGSSAASFSFSCSCK